ncbi:MAG: hypothetical protein A3J08_03570 [Candidatus Lloydbacteria bacterium RIFCSPLOWO2_02_FULL_51_11]|nr:MAG: hypothetical protein A3J08_03570 [Candidatus Lloydbacteria bacterium RIFCSPLOWO2_02_FULL_51_11]
MTTKNSLVFVSLFVAICGIFLFVGIRGVYADSSTISVSVTDGEAFHEEAIVYTAGGTASLTNTNSTTVSATIPANFYTENLRVQLTSYANDYFVSTKPEPFGVDFIGKAYDFTLRKTNGTVVSDTILQPISFTLSYTSSEVSGYTESSLAPYHYNDSTSAWDAISSFTLDTSAKTVTFSASSFSSFAIFGTPTPAASNTTTTTGGGGGGGVVAPPTEVFFYGFAYPESTVLLLKNAQVVSSTRAKADASFQFSLTGITPGTHTFGVVGEDASGHRSVTQSFTVKLTSAITTTLTGIVVPPTVMADKTDVRKGDTVKIEGKAQPGATVALYLGDTGNKIKKILAHVSANTAGSWSYMLPTVALALGGYDIQALAEKGENKTGLSQSVSFTVGLENKVATLFAKAPTHVDFNKDNKVNLIDFSIAAFWFKKESPPAHVDTNGDGKVDLVDFSILAYYWTG